MAYGYEGDATGDANSRMGIGDDQNQLFATADHQSVALTKEGRLERFGVWGKHTGQPFTVDGKTYYDDDTAPTSFTYKGEERHNSPSLIDVYDPSHPPDKEGRGSLTARKQQPELYTPHTQEEWDQIYAQEFPHEETEPKEDNSAPLEKFRKRFPEDNDIKDEDVLAGMRKRMDPDNIISPDKFATLARSQNGWKAIQSEVDKGMNGLQRLRKQFPEANNKSDDDFLLPIYNRLTRNEGLDPRTTSFSDFKEQMSPQSGPMNAMWQFWKGATREASAVAHAEAGKASNFPSNATTSVKAFSDMIYQLMDKVSPDEKPGTQVKTMAQKADEWLAKTDVGQDMLTLQRGWKEFVGMFAGWGQSQMQQMNVDEIRAQQAGRVAGKAGRVVGGAVTSMGVGMLTSLIPGAPLKSAAVIAGAYEGISRVGAAVQAHHDNALLEGISGFGMGAVYRYMWNSPNGRLLSGFTTWLADAGEDTISKWLKGEPVDYTEAGIRSGIDIVAGVLSGRHLEAPSMEGARARELTASEVLGPETPGTQMRGSVFGLSTQQGLLTPSLLLEGARGLPEGGTPSEMRAGAEAIGTRLSLTLNASMEELGKANEARSNGDTAKATEHMDRALSELPIKEQKEVAKQIIKFAHDAAKNNGETKVDKATKKIEKPKSPEVDKATEIINSHFYGLGNRGERGAIGGGGKPAKKPRDEGEWTPEVKPGGKIEEPTVPGLSGLVQRKEAGFVTLPWQKEIGDWFDEHWRAAIRPGQATFKPQSLGPEAETVWQKAKFRTSEAQQAIAAVPVQIAKALGVDEVMRGGERVDRRAAAFNTQSDAQLKEILASTEEGDIHTGNPHIDWIMNDFWKTVNQAIYRNERAADFDHPEVPEYFPQWWKEKAPDQFQKYWDHYRTTPAWTLHRKFPNWRQGLEAGFEPAILNPERIGQARLASSFNNIKKVMTLRDAAKAGAAIAKEGLSKEERKALEDDPDYTDITAPNKEAYFLKNTAKQVLNITWEPSTLFTKGLTGTGFDAPLWKTAAAAKGITARQILGLSFAHLFHVGFTHPASIAAGLTRVALSAPDKAKAFRNVFKALARNPRSSLRILNAWRGYETLTHPDEIQMLDHIKRMGINLGTNEEAMMQFSENIRRWLPDWLRKAPLAESNLIKAGYHALDAVMDWQFGVAIPFLKTSAALHDLQVIYNTRPDLMKPGKEEALKTEIAKHGDTIDTRFGEMNMANLFWKKVVKDIGKSVLLAFGWQINVAKFYGQAVHDMTTNAAHKAFLHARGKAHEPFITDHLLFTFYYTATIMAANAARQFLFTGQSPEGKDYLLPRIGKDAQGNWIRARPIEFTTEAAILAHHIDKEGGWDAIGISKGVGAMALNKLSPVISDTVKWWGNKNYFGQEYYNELDPWYKKIWDSSEQILASTMTPIPLQDLTVNTGHPFTLGGFFTSMFGLPRAPSWADRTQNENRIADTYHRMFPKVSTPESAARSNAHQALAAAIRDKDDKARAEAVSKLRGMGVGDQSIKMTIGRAHELPGDQIKYYFKEIGKKFPEYQVKLLHLMSPEELKTYLPLASPFAKKQFGGVGGNGIQRPPTTKHAALLPSGTYFFDPEGNLRVRP